MNKVFLIGNLTKDPELNQTANGIYVCKFTLAITRRFSNTDRNTFLKKRRTPPTLQTP